MGIKRATIAKAVGSAMKALGELVVSATYRRTVSVYTPGNSTMVNTDTDYVVPIVMLSFNSYEIDRVNVVVGDRKGIIQTKDLGITPQVTSDTVLYNNKTYNIVRWMEDPSGSVVTLHLRAP